MVAKKKRFRKQQQLVILVDGLAYAVAKGYMDNKDCPLGTAIKQQFSRIRDLYVGGTYVSINGIEYRFLDGGEALQKLVEKRINLSVVLVRTQNR